MSIKEYIFIRIPTVTVGKNLDVSFCAICTNAVIYLIQLSSTEER